MVAEIALEKVDGLAARRRHGLPCAAPRPTGLVVETAEGPAVLLQDQDDKVSARAPHESTTSRTRKRTATFPWSPGSVCRS